MEIFPLNPVITSNPILTSHYNKDLKNSYLLSECLTLNQVEKLLEQNAVFNKLIFVNGEGEELVAQLGDINNWDNELMPLFEHYRYTGDNNKAIEEIHNLLKANRTTAGLGCGMG